MVDKQGIGLSQLHVGKLSNVKICLWILYFNLSTYVCIANMPFFSSTTGKSPQNVTDFSCIVYDYEYMQCSFTRPENMLMTEYELEYRFANDVSSRSWQPWMPQS